MNELRPLSLIDTLQIMVVETKNELTKCKIMDRLMQRQSLKGAGQKNTQMLVMNQAKIKALESSLLDLEDIQDYEEAEIKRLSPKIDLTKPPEKLSIEA